MCITTVDGEARLKTVYLSTSSPLYQEGEARKGPSIKDPSTSVPLYLSTKRAKHEKARQAKICLRLYLCTSLPRGRSTKRPVNHRSVYLSTKRAKHDQSPVKKGHMYRENLSANSNLSVSWQNRRSLASSPALEACLVTVVTVVSLASSPALEACLVTVGTCRTASSCLSCMTSFSYPPLLLSSP